MRADLFLSELSYIESRQKAQRLIKNGCVVIDGLKVMKPSEEIDESKPHDVEIKASEEEKYVSRGGLKLEAALLEFGVSVRDCVCADIGASTGGFTDCLLKNGAEKVYAFDSGRGQLHPSLSVNERVISREGFNARYITPEDVGEDVDVIVMDVSFISQSIILPALKTLLAPGGRIISLIKPQFEAGRGSIGKNGIVSRREDRLASVIRVVECAEMIGLACVGLITSPIKGGDGNVEYLAHFEVGMRKTDNVLDKEGIKRIVYERQ